MVSGDERSVAGEHNHLIVTLEGLAGDHQSVPGSALLALQHEPDLRGGDGFADPIRFMANDDVNVLGRDHLGGGMDDVRQ